MSRDCVVGTVIRLCSGRPRRHVSVQQVRDSPKCTEIQATSCSTDNMDCSLNILSIKHLADEDGYTLSSETQVKNA